MDARSTLAVVALALAMATPALGELGLNATLYEGMDLTDMGDYTLYRINWNDETPYDEVPALCGDQVEFYWNTTVPQNVGVAEEGDCDSVYNATEPALQGSVIYTLDDSLEGAAAYGEVLFASNLPDRCEEGQRISFYVDCSISDGSFVYDNTYDFSSFGIFPDAPNSTVDD